MLSSGSHHTRDKSATVLQEGNSRRKTESTDANAASSRSHAILEVTVCRSDRNHYQKQVRLCKLPSRRQQLCRCGCHSYQGLPGRGLLCSKRYQLRPAAAQAALLAEPKTCMLPKPSAIRSLWGPPVEAG